MQTPALKTDATYGILLSSFHLPFDPKPGNVFQDSNKSVTAKTDQLTISEIIYLASITAQESGDLNFGKLM